MEEYLNVIYNYYPKDIYPSDNSYLQTPEITSQWQLIERERGKLDYFERMTTELVQLTNSSNKQDFSLRGIFDLSCKCMFYLPDNRHHIEFPCCVINVSIVAKFYAIYFTRPTGLGINPLSVFQVTDEQKIIADMLISKVIKRFYPGFKAFPMDYFNKRVPNVLSGKRWNEEATYFECLITDEIF